MKVMRLPLIYVLTLLTIKSTHANDIEDTTLYPTATEISTLCLNVKRITLTGINWISQMKSPQTEAIFYVYDPIHSIATFQSFKFPIDTTTTQFNFKDNPSSVLCWNSASFSTLNIRFKVYELYHTALKAISAIQISSNASMTVCLHLITLPYQYSTANVSIYFTLTWNTQQPLLINAPLVPKSPPIPPVQPPVDLDAAMDVLTDNMIASEQVPADNVESGAVIGEESSSTDWMFIAALCSSMLGLFILVYICVWAYKSYGRKDYEWIPSGMNSSDANILRRKRISLRNVSVGNGDEQKSIMHPSASYTLNDK